MEQIKEKDIFEIVDQLIITNEKFEKDKLKLYCEYCLSLGKEYLDSVVMPGLYEACEKFNISNNKMEDIEKETKLGIEAIDICEEILKYTHEQDRMRIAKAKAYCEFFLCYKLDGVNTTEIKERCKKYLENLDNFKRDYKFVLNDNLDNECLLDFGGEEDKGIIKLI